MFVIFSILLIFEIWKDAGKLISTNKNSLGSTFQDSNTGKRADNLAGNVGKCCFRSLW